MSHRLLSRARRRTRAPKRRRLAPAWRGAAAGGAVAPLLRELKTERERLTARRRSAPLAVDLETLRPRIEARVLELRETFAGDRERRRIAFRALLGDRRMRIFPGPERCFRLEGVFELRLPETADSRPLDGTGRLQSQVAGARNARGCRLPVELELPVEGSVRRAA